MKKSKGKSSKPDKKSPYYTPATWHHRLREKLERGDPPGDCLRYSHQKDEYPPEVRAFIVVASKVEEATKLLATLMVGKTAPLTNSIGKKIPSSDGLMKIIKLLRGVQPDVDVEIRDNLLQIIPKEIIPKDKE